MLVFSEAKHAVPGTQGLEHWKGAMWSYSYQNKGRGGEPKFLLEYHSDLSLHLAFIMNYLLAQGW